MKRQRKVPRDNFHRITKSAIIRLARRAGVKRISGLIYGETREILQVFLENFSISGNVNRTCKREKEQFRPWMFCMLSTVTCQILNFKECRCNIFSWDSQSGVLEGNLVRMIFGECYKRNSFVLSKMEMSSCFNFSQCF